MRLKHGDFLLDVLILACTSFGGPQVHFALFLDRLVKKRAYLSEEELFEIQALGSVLPGPTSTQMITAIGLKRGGASLAYLTLLCWITPAVLIMTAAALGMTLLRNNSILHYVLPVGIGLILQAGWYMAKKVITGPMYVIILLVTLFLGIAFQSPYIFPLVLLLGGIVSSFNYKDFPRQNKHKFVIPWANFHLYWGFLLLLAIIGHFTDYFPIRIFELKYKLVHNLEQ